MTRQKLPGSLHTDERLKVVVIGGGTGNATLLAGLKPYIGDNLTAVVNTFDDGGGTGRIRAEYGGIAVGDLRQCARAMSDLSADALSVLERRFGPGTGSSGMNIDGQTVGNLILAQSHQMFVGDPERIARTYSDIYRIRGRVLPVSHDSRRLKLTMTDGTIVVGEHLAEQTDIASLKGASIGYDGPAHISDHARDAIKGADIVVLAPGDLYTSLAPTLAVEGMSDALSSGAFIILVVNLMNRNRHTVGYTVADYADEYERIMGAKIDRVLYNTGLVDKSSLNYQMQRGSYPVEANEADLAKHYHAVGTNLVSNEHVVIDAHDAIGETRSTIRHDPHKVAAAIMGLQYTRGVFEDLFITTSVH